MKDSRVVLWRAPGGAICILAMHLLAGSVLLACFAFLWLNAPGPKVWPKRRT